MPRSDPVLDLSLRISPCILQLVQSSSSCNAAIDVFMLFQTQQLSVAVFLALSKWIIFSFLLHIYTADKEKDSSEYWYQSQDAQAKKINRLFCNPTRFQTNSPLIFIMFCLYYGELQTDCNLMGRTFEMTVMVSLNITANINAFICLVHAKCKQIAAFWMKGI